MAASDPSRPQTMSVQVVHVLKKDAKIVKTLFEGKGWLDKDFRMAPSLEHNECIAIPVVEVSVERVDWSTIQGFQGMGYQQVPYSSYMLGDPTRQKKKRNRSTSTSEKASWNMVQVSLYASLSKCSGIATESPEKAKGLKELVSSLPLSTCPRNLEFFGDDRTLVVPPNALDPLHDDRLTNLVLSFAIGELGVWLSQLWQELAMRFKSPRVVRRGAIDPDSGIRHSGFRLLWPFDGIPDTTGPGSPGWITVTEQGVRQSFDLTRVMFSRGNISEKIRFGKLVQEGECVLDLYSGIGYFTLPALIHGRAAQVMACEWNPDAVAALKFNLADNGVVDRATVMFGDCRDQDLSSSFDRVSLGLLPSSEGGWRTAVKALRRAKDGSDECGGWLHIHGNVPVSEADQWAHWVCLQLRMEVDEDQTVTDWVVVANHVEKVKSFAPTVNHYVIDVYVGPLERWMHTKTESVLALGETAVVNVNGSVVLCPMEIQTPSCALSSTGVLHQAWMRATEGA